MSHFYTHESGCSISTHICRDVPYLHTCVGMFHTYTHVSGCSIPTHMCRDIQFLHTWVGMFHTYTHVSGCTIPTQMCRDVPYLHTCVAMYHIYTHMSGCIIPIDCTHMCRDVIYLYTCVWISAPAPALTYLLSIIPTEYIQIGSSFFARFISESVLQSDRSLNSSVSGNWSISVTDI